MYKKGNGYLGVVPDMSIFQKKPHKLLVERMKKAGFREDRLAPVLALQENGETLEKALKLDLSEDETEFTQLLFEKFNPTSLDELDAMIPITPYIHGKFYYLENGEKDDCIPYEKILPRLIRLGYTGHIAAEYEGHHFNLDIDVPQQLERFASICNRYL